MLILSTRIMVLDPAVIASIQDQTALAVVSGLVSGAASGFVSPAITWVRDRYKGHPKDAIKAAQINTVNFLGQVNVCLEGQQQIENIEDKKQQALSDPDYTSLFQEAVLGAARTNSEQKHKLLARLVTDRLTAEPDSLQALSVHMACNAVPQLSKMHLKLLGVLYIIRHQPAPSYIMDLPYDERIDVGNKWCLTEIAPFIPIGGLTDLDFAHLTAVSCITYVPQLEESMD